MAVTHSIGATKTVGVRELRQNLSRYLARVKEGETLTVTERGHEVARLVPSSPDIDPYYLELAEKYGATIPKGNLVETIEESAAARKPRTSWHNGRNARRGSPGSLLSR